MVERYQHSSKTGNTIQDIIGLEKKVFAKADSWADVLEKEAKKRSSLLLFSRDAAGKPAAYILCSITGLNIHVVKLGVREDCRRRGLASALLREAMRTALRDRRQSASLYVAADNAAAVALYRSAGFEQDAYLPDYYRPGHHALRMVIPDLEGCSVLQAWLNGKHSSDNGNKISGGDAEDAAGEVQALSDKLSGASVNSSSTAAAG